MTAWHAVRPETERSVSRMITGLLGERPPMWAPVQERATWFAHKGEVFDRIAEAHAQDGDVVRASEARLVADEARGTASTLQREADTLDSGALDHPAVTAGRFEDSDYVEPPSLAWDDGDGLP